MDLTCNCPAGGRGRMTSLPHSFTDTEDQASTLPSLGNCQGLLSIPEVVLSGHEPGGMGASRARVLCKKGPLSPCESPWKLLVCTFQGTVSRSFLWISVESVNFYNLLLTWIGHISIWSLKEILSFLSHLKWYQEYALWWRVKSLGG